MEKVISATMANHLFWLGRYVERGYLMLHLMRRAYDEVIDVPVGEKLCRQSYIDWYEHAYPQDSPLPLSSEQ